MDAVACVRRPGVALWPPLTSVPQPVGERDAVGARVVIPEAQVRQVKHLGPDLYVGVHAVFHLQSTVELQGVAEVNGVAVVVHSQGEHWGGHPAGADVDRQAEACIGGDVVFGGEHKPGYRVEHAPQRLSELELALHVPRRLGVVDCETAKSEAQNIPRIGRCRLNAEQCGRGDPKRCGGEAVNQLAGAVYGRSHGGDRTPNGGQGVCPGGVWTF